MLFAPVPANERELKLNENAVSAILNPEIPCVVVCAVPGLVSLTLGLKSIAFLRSNSPDGSLCSGSTLVAE